MLPRVTIPITDLKGKVDIQYWVLLLSHSLCLTPVLKDIRVVFFSIPFKCGPSEKYARYTQWINDTYQGYFTDCVSILQ